MEKKDLGKEIKKGEKGKKWISGGMLLSAQYILYPWLNKERNQGETAEDSEKKNVSMKKYNLGLFFYDTSKL